MMQEIPTVVIQAFAHLAQEMSGPPPQNITGFHITGVRICDHCKDPDKEAFPYGAIDASGQEWADLCNDCFDQLGCTFADGPRSDICPADQHVWIEDYYGFECDKCGLVIPYGSEPWAPGTDPLAVTFQADSNGLSASRAFVE